MRMATRGRDLHVQLTRKMKSQLRRGGYFDGAKVRQQRDALDETGGCHWFGIPLVAGGQQAIMLLSCRSIHGSIGTVHGKQLSLSSVTALSRAVHGKICEHTGHRLASRAWGS